MLIGGRNGFLVDKRLPYDAEIEYLESTGTQWIDTATQLADKVQMSVWVNSIGGDMKIWGNSYCLGKWADISWYQSFYRGTQIPQAAQTWDTFTIEKSPKKLTVERGGETFSTDSWWAANDGSATSEWGTAVPLFAHINRAGIWYGDNRIGTWYNSGYYLRISFFQGLEQRRPHPRPHPRPRGQRRLRVRPCERRVPALRQQGQGRLRAGAGQVKRSPRRERG